MQDCWGSEGGGAAGAQGNLQDLGMAALVAGRPVRDGGAQCKRCTRARADRGLPRLRASTISSTSHQQASGTAGALGTPQQPSLHRDCGARQRPRCAVTKRSCNPSALQAAERRPRTSSGVETFPGPLAAPAQAPGAAGASLHLPVASERPAAPVVAGAPPPLALPLRCSPPQGRPPAGPHPRPASQGGRQRRASPRAAAGGGSGGGGGHGARPCPAAPTTGSPPHAPPGWMTSEAQPGSEGVSGAEPQQQPAGVKQEMPHSEAAAAAAASAEGTGPASGTTDSGGHPPSTSSKVRREGRAQGGAGASGSEPPVGQ